MLEPSEHVTLFTREPVAPGRLPTCDSVTMQTLRPRLTGLTWQSFVLARRASDLDVLFCPSYAAPLWYAGRTVVAIHSMNEVHSAAHPWWYRHTYSRLYRRSALRAARVIVPAEVTRRDLVTHYGIEDRKVVIAPQGAPASFAPTHDDQLIAATRRRLLGSDRPYVLFVGKLSQRRNIPALMAGFAMLKKQHDLPHALVLFGPNHLNLPIDRLADDLGIRDSFFQTDGRVQNHDELVPIYGAADVFVHPSSYEGFSMTTVEALACGVPVITVDRAALKEVVDGCARLVAEPTPEALADALWEVLRDPQYRKELSGRSLSRSKLFSWEQCARITLDILRKVGRG